MTISAIPVRVEDILPWRDLYRQEMHCQIVHDDMHARAGWTQPYLIRIDDAPAGYGSILIGGPWTGTRTAFEFYLSPAHRSRAFDCFESFLAASQSNRIKAQTNDALLTVMLHLWAPQHRKRKDRIRGQTNHLSPHRRRGSASPRST